MSPARGPVQVRNRVHPPSDQGRNRVHPPFSRQAPDSGDIKMRDEATLNGEASACQQHCMQTACDEASPAAGPSKNDGCKRPFDTVMPLGSKLTMYWPVPRDCTA